jgi:hypothetical protein
MTDSKRAFIEHDYGYPFGGVGCPGYPVPEGVPVGKPGVVVPWGVPVPVGGVPVPPVGDGVGVADEVGDNPGSGVVGGKVGVAVTVRGRAGTVVPVVIGTVTRLSTVGVTVRPGVEVGSLSSKP